MRFKLAPSSMLLAALCICLMGEDLWLKNAPASYTGRIVFTSRRDGNFEIYVMDANGGNQVNLTNHRAYDGDPDWSPDGTKIAFISGRDGAGFQIYVMDAHGKNPIRLTDGPGEKRHPDWSPDGGRIAFSVHNRFDVDHIDVMDADGGNREKLETVAMYPSWSPDGKQIAFAQHGDIYVIGVDGQGRKRVTHDLEHKLNPSFSPDGRRIAYDAHTEGFGHIYAVDADGRNRVRLTRTRNNEHHFGPAWSPDGQVMVYWVWDGMWPGNFRGGTIHLIASDGRYIRQLSHGRNALDLHPDISPLGLAVSPASNKSTTWGRLKKVELNRR